jgi:hypothetical protein
MPQVNRLYVYALPPIFLILAGGLSIRPTSRVFDRSPRLYDTVAPRLLIPTVRHPNSALAGFLLTRTGAAE